MQVGNNLRIDFDIESREFNGKWFTDMKAKKIEVIGDVSQNIPSDPLGTFIELSGNDDNGTPF